MHYAVLKLHACLIVLKIYYENYFKAFKEKLAKVYDFVGSIKESQ